MYSKLILNGNIIDGSGGKPFQADIAIEDDLIVQIGNLKKARAQEIIDAQGKYVTPGFVDIQNHSDVYWTLFDNPSSDSLVAQGITTILIGNCGASLAPLLSRNSLLSMQKWHNLEGVNFDWLTFSEYIQHLSQKRFGVNVASLVGYSTLRRGLIGDEIRALTESEMKILERMLAESLEAGAFGLSSGLSYAHEIIISGGELIRLGKIIKDREALLSMHLRSEGSELTESVSEVIELVNKLNVNLKISHFKARNKSNWHLLPHALNLIEETYQKKGNIHFDLYPYDFIWQVLYLYLPRWAYEGGREMIIKNLKDPVRHKKVLAYLSSKDIDYSQIFIAGTAMPLNVVGKSLGEIAKRLDLSSEEALTRVIENGGTEILVFDRSLDQSQVEQLLAHSLSMIASDGAGFAFKYKDRLVHPRCFGSMPRFLGLVSQKNLMPIEKAVQKITSIPAEKAGIKKRGKIAVDYYADVVVMDAVVNSFADYYNHFRLPEGIDYVFVNGEKSFELGYVLPKLSGKVLRKT